jgi:hypothetical protein
MTVAELIAKLSALPEDSLVVMSEDSEGNGFSPLAELGADNYAADTSSSGELTDDEDEGVVPAVVLWPVR